MPCAVETCLPDADRELASRVRHCLFEKHVPSLRRVSIEVAGGVVTLRGQVRSFYEKQLCHSLSRHVPGVIRIIDAVEVGAALASPAA